MLMATNTPFDEYLYGACLRCHSNRIEVCGARLRLSDRYFDTKEYKDISPFSQMPVYKGPELNGRRVRVRTRV